MGFLNKNLSVLIGMNKLRRSSNAFFQDQSSQNLSLMHRFYLPKRLIKMLRYGLFEAMSEVTGNRRKISMWVNGGHLSPQPVNPGGWSGGWEWREGDSGESWDLVVSGSGGNQREPVRARDIQILAAEVIQTKENSAHKITEINRFLSGLVSTCNRIWKSGGSIGPLSLTGVVQLHPESGPVILLDHGWKSKRPRVDLPESELDWIHDSRLDLMASGGPSDLKLEKQSLARFISLVLAGGRERASDSKAFQNAPLEGKQIWAKLLEGQKGADILPALEGGFGKLFENSKKDLPWFWICLLVLSVCLVPVGFLYKNDIDALVKKWIGQGGVEPPPTQPPTQPPEKPPTQPTTSLPPSDDASKQLANLKKILVEVEKDLGTGSMAARRGVPQRLEKALKENPSAEKAEGGLEVVRWAKLRISRFSGKSPDDQDSPGK